LPGSEQALRARVVKRTRRKNARFIKLLLFAWR
jgi:hypothetical protein